MHTIQYTQCIQYNIIIRYIILNLYTVYHVTLILLEMIQLACMPAIAILISIDSINNWIGRQETYMQAECQSDA